MSQTIFEELVPVDVSGTELATHLNAFRDALLTGLSGASRPTLLDEGGTWVSTAVADHLVLYMFVDGEDVEICRIHTTTKVISFSGVSGKFYQQNETSAAAWPELEGVPADIITIGSLEDGDYFISGSVWVGRKTGSTRKRGRVQIEIVGGDYNRAMSSPLEDTEDTGVYYWAPLEIPRHKVTISEMEGAGEFTLRAYAISALDGEDFPDSIEILSAMLTVEGA